MKLSSIKIDVIYVINLEIDVERKKKMKFLLENNFTNKIIFIKGHDFRNKEIGNNIKFLSSSGAYGCTLSHLDCIKDAIINNYNNIIIFEDDVLIHNNFNNLWNTICIPDIWNIIHLGAMQINWNNITINEYYYKSNKTLGGFSYILNSTIFNKVIELFDIHCKPIDELLVIIQNEYPCYTIYPNLFINYINKSYIRKYNKWTLEKTGVQFKWCIDNYEIN